MRVYIDRITVAVNNMPAMVHFYNAVFGAGLMLADPHSEFDFHVGRLGQLELFFCPNSITQIEAEKNRQQLRIVVEDVRETIALAVAAGGQMLGEIHVTDEAIVGGVSDPDGNSIELIQYLQG